MNLIINISISIFLTNLFFLLVLTMTDIISLNLFRDQSFFDFDDNGNKLFLGKFNFDDAQDINAIEVANKEFEEYVSKINNKTLNDEKLSPTTQADSIYPQLVVSINSDKVKDLLILGITNNQIINNSNERIIYQNNSFLSFKNKMMNNDNNNTYNITMEEHEKYNLKMLEDNLKGNYQLLIRIITEKTSYDLAIRYEKKGQKGEHWCTWFYTIGEQKLFHFKIHPKIRVGGKICTKIAIDAYQERRPDSYQERKSNRNNYH